MCMGVCGCGASGGGGGGEEGSACLCVCVLQAVQAVPSKDVHVEDAGQDERQQSAAAGADQRHQVGEVGHCQHHKARQHHQEETQHVLTTQASQSQLHLTQLWESLSSLTRARNNLPNT